MQTRASLLALAAALTAAFSTPLASATLDHESLAGPTPFASPPPRLHRQMEWFRWHPNARSLQERASRFGSAAVIGLASMRDLESLREQYGFDDTRAIGDLHAAEVSVDPAQLRALLANAPTDPRVRYIAPVGPPRHLLGMPNDPLLRTINPAIGLPAEWQFAVSHVERALELSPGSPAIVVGTIDSGVADVPDLAGKVDSRWSITHDGTLTLVPELEGNDTEGHGTAVASLIAANVGDGFGMAGFGGATRLIAVRDDLLTDTSIAVSLMKLVSLGARIVNMSFGGHTPDAPIVLDAIHKAAAAGVLLVAAAGNEAGRVDYPAADLQPPGGGRSFGLAVGASNFDGGLADFSNTGENVSLVAPGNYDGMCSGVLVAMAALTPALDQSCYPIWPGDGGARYAYLAGTSFSAPEVAGIAALIWAARPELLNYEVADLLKRSARRGTATGWTPTLGCGVLDAGAALELATGGPSRSNSADTSCAASSDGPATWPAAVTLPCVTAVAASAKWGTVARLQFRAGGTSGEFAPTIIVKKNGKGVALLTHDFVDLEPGRVYSLPWRVPRVKKSGFYTFCVTLSDRTANKSAPSCGPIRMS